MAGNIPNRQAICEALMEQAANDREVVVLCSDSRGSASLGDFAKAFPEQFIDVGIAEQCLVSVAAGLAKCGKKAFAASPASFLSTRSFEQIKVDVAYSGANAKLIGISGGISYGALGMTHHSAQDIAAISAIPGMRVYLPSDRHQSALLLKALLRDELPAYIRVGRNPVADVYAPGNVPFALDHSTLVRVGNDAAIIACGEMVLPAKQASELLAQKGIGCRVLDMYCVKPIDRDAVLKAARETKAIITAEEHSSFGGLGAMVSQIVAALGGVAVRNIALPDAPVVTGSSTEVFSHYHMDADGLAQAVEEVLCR